MEERPIPESVSSEIAVLGCLVLDPSLVPEVMQIVEPSDFYRPEYEFIFQQMIEMWTRDGGFDLLSLNQTLRDSNQWKQYGWESLLAGLVSSVATPSQALQHAKIVRDKSVARKLNKLAYKIQELALNEEVGGINALDKAEQLIQQFSNKVYGSMLTEEDLVSAEEKREEALDYMVNAEKMVGRSTGIRELDRLMHGFGPEELLVIGGETGIGKSMIMQKIALEFARVNAPVMYLSLEMSVKQQLARMYQMNATNHAKPPDSVAEVSKMPLYFYAGKEQMNLKLLERIIKLAKEKHQAELICIDHLHYFSSSTEDITNEIGVIVRTIKHFAKKYQVAIALIATLRKQNRKNIQVPTIDDLKDSVMIGYDADFVLLAARDVEGDNYPEEQMLLALRKNRPRNDKGLFDLKITDNFDLVSWDGNSVDMAKSVFGTPYKD